MIERCDRARGKRLGLEPRGGQHLDFATGQHHPDQAQRQLVVRVDARLLAHLARKPAVAAKLDDLLRLAAGDELLHRTVVAGAQTHQKLLTALQKLAKQPMGGIAPVENNEAVGRSMVEMQRRAAALVHRRGDQQRMQGLAVAQIVEHRQPCHGVAAVGAEILRQRRLQRKVDVGAVHAQQPHPAPVLTQLALIKLVLQCRVERLQRRVVKLVSCLAEGLGGDHRLLKGRFVQGLEKLIQLRLKGTVGLVEQK